MKVVEVGIVGPQAPGIPGPPGNDADRSFVFIWDQAAPAAVWNINHDLDGFPNITVVDSGLDEVEGDVLYLDNNNIRVTFSAAFAGKAYLS